MKLPRIVQNSINKRKDTVEFYHDKTNQWRWRYVSFENGKVLADSGQGYTNYRDAEWGARRVTGRRGHKVRFVKKLGDING